MWCGVLGEELSDWPCPIGAPANVFPGWTLRYEVGLLIFPSFLIPSLSISS